MIRKARLIEKPTAWHKPLSAQPVTIQSMLKFSSSFFFRGACLVFAILLAGCSPEYNWREVQGGAAPFTVLLPAKPATHTRQINLDGRQVTMAMTGAEVDGVTFAVGAAELEDAAQAPAALLAMKTALVRNIKGQVKQEKLTGPANAPTVIDLEAVGAADPRTGDAPALFARFAAKDKRIYQAIVLGKEKSVKRDAVDTFLSSFKY